MSTASPSLEPAGTGLAAGYPIPSKNLGAVYQAGYSAFDRNNHLMILSSGTYTFSPVARFSSDSISIYAETIALGGNYDAQYFGGKNIGLYCNDLYFSDHVTIDVSGAAGDTDPAANSVGADGADGGNIDIFVQNSHLLLEPISQKLRLISNGGDGGNGMPDLMDKTKGGAGGKPGSGGNITFQYGSAIARIGEEIESARQLRPDKMLAAIQDIMRNNATWWNVANIDVASFLKLKMKNAAYPQPLNGLVRQLRTTSTTYGAPKSIKTLAAALYKQARAIQTSHASIPAFSTKDISNMKQLQARLNTWQQDGVISPNPILTKITIQAMSDFKFPTANVSTDSTVAAVDTLYQQVWAGYENMALDLAHQFSANPGRSGVAGTTTGDGPNALGQSTGLAGFVRVNNVKFDSSPGDTNLDSPILMPEQVQMVLDDADDSYFAGKIGDAYRKYLIIVERLSLISTSGLNPALETAINNLAGSGLTIQPLSTLQRVLSTATSRLYQIRHGRNMFGKAANWAPRLTYSTFYTNAQTMLQTLLPLETALNSYLQALTDHDGATAAIQSAIGQLTDSCDNAQTDLTYWDGANPSGPIAQAGASIAALTPLLVQKQNLVSGTLASVEAKLQTGYNWDWGTVLDSFASWAIMPTGFGGLAQTADTLFKFGTQVEDSTGNWVDKSNVVQSFQNAAQNLTSMSNQYTQNLGGSLSVDDAGFDKLLGTSASLTTLVQSYQQALGSQLSTTFLAQLNDYVNTTQTRNTAVMDYNAGLQSYQQAYTAFQSCQSMQGTAGQQQLLQDPTIPSTLYWLSNMIRSQQYSIMQNLNYGSRSVRLFGLGLTQPAKFAAGGLLPSYNLSLDAQALQSAYQNAVSLYAGNTLTTFPQSKDEPGWFIPLAEAKVAALKIGQNTTEGMVYAVYFTPPRKPNSNNIDVAQFSSACNLRLRSARVWLPGARVNKNAFGQRPMMSHLIHTGVETIYNVNRGPVQFSHDSVTYGTTIDTTNLDHQANCTSKRVLDEQNVLSSDYTSDAVAKPTAEYVPTGPLTTWKLVIYERENPGLNLTNVKNMYYEFRGWYNQCN